MNSELKLLLIAGSLLLIGLLFLLNAKSHCQQVEYQDLNGTHYTQVCGGE
jgi:hypothetical protein